MGNPGAFSTNTGSSTLTLNPLPEGRIYFSQLISYVEAPKSLNNAPTQYNIESFQVFRPENIPSMINIRICVQ